MRVTLLVGVRVMAAVCGDPRDQLALNGHRSGNAEQPSQRLHRFERLVGEVPVEADRHADTGEQIEGKHDPKVGGLDAAAPQRDHGPDHRSEGDDRHHDGDVALEGELFAGDRDDALDALARLSIEQRLGHRPRLPVLSAT